MRMLDRVRRSQALASCSRWKCRGSLMSRRKTRLCFCAGTLRIESGRLRSERYRLAIFSKSAITAPRAKASATKYQSVGKPRTKMSALPPANRTPMNPPPNVILCIVMPGWRVSAMGTCVGLMISPRQAIRNIGQSFCAFLLCYSRAVFQSTLGRS